ncbi:MAG: site-2 protease family protein [Verrucomicrobia bacterium]|nr:site-2 protease family protein [Verrucomicrobiota bacterium]
MDFDLYAVREGALRFIVIVLSLSMHEWGHAVVADKLGDDTPRSQGRVTMFPLAHIDWIGTILMPLLGAMGFFGSFAMIGWAKPVYTNPSNFRRGQFDQALVTIAGPGVNFALALLATLGMVVAVRMQSGAVVDFFQLVVGVNVGLMVFNLLPIPPLDGSKFLMYWFGMSEEMYSRLATFGSFVLLLLINIPAFRQFLTVLFRAALIPFNALLVILT